MHGRAAVLVMSLLVLLVCSAAPAPAESVAVASGTTVLSGDSTARMTLRFERDSLIDLRLLRRPDGYLQPAALETAGGAGFVGFSLVDPSTDDGLSVVATRTPFVVDTTFGSVTAFAEGRGRQDPSAAPEPLKPKACTRCVIPAGDYDLYLITGGAGARVTMHVEGLEGESSFEPDVEIGAVQFTPDARTAPGSASPVGTSSGSRELFLHSIANPDVPGYFIDSFNVRTANRGAAPAITSATDCRQLEHAYCRDHLLTAANPSAGAVTLTRGVWSRGTTIRQSTRWTVEGSAAVTTEQAIMWLPTSAHGSEVDSAWPGQPFERYQEAPRS